MAGWPGQGRAGGRAAPVAKGCGRRSQATLVAQVHAELHNAPILRVRLQRQWIQEGVNWKQFVNAREDIAERLLAAKNEAARIPEMNLQIARVYLSATDGGVSTRTWRNVMAEISRVAQ